MLTQCPHCQKAIVVPEPGIHDCSRCNARIWISKPGDDKPDRVLISPEVIQQHNDRNQPDSTQLGPILESEPKSLVAPWEERRRIGFSRAIVTTWKATVFLPAHFFSALKTDLPTTGVAIYGWIFYTLGYAFWALYRLLFAPFMLEMQQKAGSLGDPTAVQNEMQGLTIMFFVASPFFAFLTVYLNAILYQAVLKMVGSGQAGFRGTLRVVSYAGSTMLFLAFPIFGDLLGFVWNVVLTVIGLSRVHGTSSTRAILAVFLPPIAMYVILLAIMRLFGGGAPPAF